LLQETFCYRRRSVTETFCMETFCQGDVLCGDVCMCAVGLAQAVIAFRTCLEKMPQFWELLIESVTAVGLA
jgi:hypothetical protein